ncbi:unnamed protein product [Linum trigynum]|uniref:Uncharacterized protein n=1 Tax=Linum trigynum TaxID=586398 RepID=A0AAV2E367_9ROSI
MRKLPGGRTAIPGSPRLSSSLVMNPPNDRHGSGSTIRHPVVDSSLFVSSAGRTFSFWSPDIKQSTWRRSWRHPSFFGFDFLSVFAAVLIVVSSLRASRVNCDVDKLPWRCLASSSLASVCNSLADGFFASPSGDVSLDGQ